MLRRAASHLARMSPAAQVAAQNRLGKGASTGLSTANISLNTPSVTIAVLSSLTGRLRPRRRALSNQASSLFPLAWGALHPCCRINCELSQSPRVVGSLILRPASVVPQVSDVSYGPWSIPAWHWPSRLAFYVTMSATMQALIQKKRQQNKELLTI